MNGSTARHLAALAILIVWTTPAFSQSRNECAGYFDAIASGNAKLPAVMPDRLLADPSVAIPCLVSIVRSMHGEVSAAGTITPSVFPRLLSVTAGLRAIMARATPSTDQPGGSQQALNDFISKFRAVDDVESTSVLAYGARSNSYDLRLNSVLLLGNVIDNTTVCVVLAHLNDPTLLSSDSGLNGRANLLSIVSVVAPWALRENYDNIKATVQSIRQTMNSADSQVKTTVGLLTNIEIRLQAQTETSNKGAWLDPQARASCANYVANFRPKIEALANVNYEPHN